MNLLKLVAPGGITVLGRIIHWMYRPPPIPHRELAGVVLGFAMCVGSARVVAVSGSIEADGAEHQAHHDRAEAGQTTSQRNGHT
jgi:hypothetical protein